MNVSRPALAAAACARALPLALAFGTALSCAQPPTAASGPGAGPIRLVAGLDTVHRPISTSSSEAQAFFDQGLALGYGFNHAAAEASFRRAAQLDPRCVMAWWGVALVQGPHINDPTMSPERSERAHEALETARRLLAEGAPATGAERALLEALAARYAWPAPDDRRPLDEAWAQAMAAYCDAYPDDLDAAALCAEAFMDLWPWDLWSADGTPRAETPAIVARLQRVLAEQPDHPLACHLLIHAVEASPRPQDAEAAADALRARVPGSGHLVHMPSHIDIRLGRYADAIVANQRAIEADARLGAALRSGGMYPIYRAHNHHFLVYAAMFEGRSELALSTARALVADLPPEFVDAVPAFVEGFLPLALHVMVRFGMWQEILREPEPAPGRLVSRATFHYARGLAFTARGRPAEARAELDAFAAAQAAVPDDYLNGNNAMSQVLAIARLMLEGELRFREGALDEGLAALRTAVALDDALKYDEPWGWMQPARHALGALLLECGRTAEAEEVYRADLARHPGNGWALTGLAECLVRRGAEDEARAVEARRRAAFARADVRPTASCYCRADA